MERMDDFSRKLCNAGTDLYHKDKEEREGTLLNLFKCPNKIVFAYLSSVTVAKVKKLGRSLGSPI